MPGQRGASVPERREQRRREQLARYEALAGSRGGTCLSSEVVPQPGKMHWRCREGHEWHAVGASIVAGTWCPTCAGWNVVTIDGLREIALARGGACLSDAYDRGVPLRWRCAEGHEWESQASNIRGGHWCPYCGHAAPLTIEDMQAEAASQGGECLSTRYRGQNAKLRWRCRFGHVFEVRASFVRQGGWCPRCRGTRELGSIARMRSIARTRGGHCISEAYVDARTKLRFRCAQGHEWDAQPANIVAGKWCPTCANARRPGRVTVTLEDMRELAESRGGACLSQAYAGAKEKMKWRCHAGHEWEAPSAQVKHSSWCPVCAKRYPGSIDGMRELAYGRGGKCVSTRYDGHMSVLRFECARRHAFELTGREVKTGMWCPACDRVRQRKVASNAADIEEGALRSSRDPAAS